MTRRWLAVAASLVAALCIAGAVRLHVGRTTSAPVDGGGTPEGELRGQALAELRQLHVVLRSLLLIESHYVDPAKVHPADMLEEALQAVARLVPEMLVDAPSRDADGHPRQLRLRIADATLPIEAGQVRDLHRLGWALLTSLRFVADRLPPEVAAAKVEYTAVNGMLGTLDQFSRLLDPDQWRDMQTSTGGQFGGLGIVVQLVDGVLTVKSVLPDSPAQQVGFAAGDQILQIDGDDTAGMGVDALVERLRGEVGTKVRVLLGRKGWPRPQEVTVARAVIHLQSVESKVLDNGIGYAKVKGFQRGTADELSQAIDNLQASGATYGLVLDLRDNPGGLLDEAVRMGDLFLAAGPVVSTVTGGQKQRDVREVTGQGRFTQLPLAVIINGHSASASEVVAGALKYSDRAIVLGEQSFGKASVQVPYPLGDAALKLTVAKYLCPGDVDLMGVGIPPDIGFAFVHATREQVDLFGGPRYSKAVRRVRALMAVQPPPKPKWLQRILLPDGPQPEGAETATERLERAPRDRAALLLRRAGDPRASVMLRRAEADLQELARADDQALVEHLRGQGIDWRAGEPTPVPQLRVQVAERDAVQANAGDVLRMSVTVSNDGKTPLHRLHLRTQCDDPTLDGHEQLVGRLEPGERRTVHLSVRVPARHGDLQVPLLVQAAQDGALLDTRDRVVATIAGRPAPAFAYRLRLDDGPGGDGVLQPGEAATLEVDVRNVGAGPAAAVVRLRSLSGGRVKLPEPQFRVGALAVGAEGRVQVKILGGDASSGHTGKLRPVADAEPARLELTVEDETSGVGRTEPVVVPWTRRPLGQLAPTVAALVRAQLVAPAWEEPPSLVWQTSLPHGTHGLAPLVAESGACTLPLTGTARFAADAPRRRFVVASVAGVKQAYVAGQAVPELPWQARLALEPGLSTVTLQAQAGADRRGEVQLLVHCQGSTTASAASPRSQAPRGGATAGR